MYLSYIVQVLTVLQYAQVSSCHKRDGEHAYIEVANLKDVRVRSALDVGHELRRGAVLEAHVVLAVHAHAVRVRLHDDLHVLRHVQLERHASIALLRAPHAVKVRIARHIACEKAIRKLDCMRVYIIYLFVSTVH